MKSPRNFSFHRIPWWIHILIATILYLTFTYWLPGLDAEIPWLKALLHAAPDLAPIAAIIFLLLGAKALYDSPESEGGGRKPEVVFRKDGHPSAAGIPAPTKKSKSGTGFLHQCQAARKRPLRRSPW
jgi:hypothetical protein